MLTWDAAPNVHCATGKVVCKRSCHVACQATTELERDLRFSSVTNRVATLNVPVPRYFSARFLGQLFEKHENRRVDCTHLSYQKDALLHIVKSPFKRTYWTIRSGHFATSIESTMITIFGWKEFCILITHPIVVSLLELFDCTLMRRHSFVLCSKELAF